ncbi:sensor histidine kinase [Singulisphaera rosea]
MDVDVLFERYQEFQSYVAWADDDLERVRGLAPILEPHLLSLVEDFYAEIARHPGAHKVFTGGQAQIDRLKGLLLSWLRDLFEGRYDREFAARRWRVGARHVEIGLDQVYTNLALSRVRDGLVRLLGECWPGDRTGLVGAIRSLNKLLDLDLAKIEDAYQAEYSARLQRSERLATLGQIAGGVAHELRNPLNVVKTSVYYLLNARNPTPEKKGEHLLRIERQVELADGVITTLSNFARMPIPTLSPTPLEPCIRESLESYPPGEDITVTLDFPASLPPALTDAGQLCIVFGNLIRNARDAMVGRGELKISARVDGDALEVAVADTGIGIPSENLSRILEPLYSTKARGLGLGLAIVRAVLDKCGGSLRVESTPGQGSVFTVRMTASPERERMG